MVRTSAFVGAVTAALALGCSLMTDTEGLAGAAAAADAGSSEVAPSAVADAAPAPSDAGAETCPCPEGSERGTSPGTCVVRSNSTHRSCTGPIVAPPCPLEYQVTVCAGDPKFTFSGDCSSTPRQAAFFSFGESPLGRWKVVASGVDSFSRTDSQCTKGAADCVDGPTATANLSPNGTAIAIGKLITAGCNTFSVEVDITADQR